MRIAVVSDVHGDLAALDAVVADLADQRVADVVVNLGDLLSGASQPRESAERLMALDWPTVRGTTRASAHHRAGRDGASDRLAPGPITGLLHQQVTPVLRRSGDVPRPDVAAQRMTRGWGRSGNYLFVQQSRPPLAPRALPPAATTWHLQHVTIDWRGRVAVTGGAVIALLVAAAGCSSSGEATATWQLSPGQALEDNTTSVTAQVSRLGCNSGVTGDVNEPRIEETGDAVTITFTVSPGEPRAANCQGNAGVTYEVELAAPLGGRTLVDGACASTEAGDTTFCDPDGTRSPT